jgi:hypothetical protein
MAEISNPGEDRAWEILSTLKPEEVCKAAGVSRDELAETYRITSFGMDFSVSPREKSITGPAPESDVLLQRLGYFFRLSVLWYLVSARDIACTERLVKLENIKGGEIFTKGSHVLPLEPLAKKYGKNREGFIEKGKGLGGEPVKFGDAALKFFPLPRVSVILALWVEDEEFPARADLLFDSSCQLQVPMDIIWSVAMMSILVML